MHHPKPAPVLLDVPGSIPETDTRHGIWGKPTDRVCRHNERIEGKLTVCQIRIDIATIQRMADISDQRLVFLANPTTNVLEPDIARHLVRLIEHCIVTSLIPWLSRKARLYCPYLWGIFL